MATWNLYLKVCVVICLITACQSEPNPEKLAEVDGTNITRADLERSQGKALTNLRQQLYEMERQKLSELIGATLLAKEAKEKGVSVTTLLEQEINSRASPVSEDEIRSFYEGHKDRIGPDFEKVREQIADYLREQKLTARKTEYFQALRSKAKVVTHLKPPPIHRVQVAVNSAPFKGAEKASITVVKFEDFECPFCKKVQPTLNDLLKRYDGKMKIVHKDLPLEAIHAQAQLAAEGARCAGDQGKFWEYHDTLYAKSPKLAAGDLKAYAKEIGLDLAIFDQCLSSGKHKAAVRKDLEEGAKLGLTGTPTFFINGREISGALPVESFAAIIDEELASSN